MSHRPTGHAMRPRCARGFTLVELLIAMTLTLMLVYAIAQFYAFVGETVRDGRAQIEMGGQLRAASQRLQQDFAELTVRVGGRIDTGQAEGCLEIVEGIRSDADPDGDLQIETANNTYVSMNLADQNGDGKSDSRMLGDIDDVLVMTIRSAGEPFVGRRYTGLDANGIPQYAVIQSTQAEVVWFTTFKDANGNSTWDIDESRYLTRRQLLIRPDLAVGVPSGTNPYFHNDISCRVGVDAMGNPVFFANNLGDLSRRENRMVHQNLAALPQNGLLAINNWMPNQIQLNVASLQSCSTYSLDGIGQFMGEDKILSDVLSFDVRVYDPLAPLRADGDTTNATAATDDDAQGVLSPGDPAYAYATLNFAQMGSGAFVDLWYTQAFNNIPAAQRTTVLNACNSSFAFAPNAASYSGVATWDTWTNAYEKDGLDQFSDSRTDLMVDGLDNDNQNGVDDPGEADTQMPYSATLRGIDVRIRIYEPGTRQTRQATVATDFIPE